MAKQKHLSEATGAWVVSVFHSCAQSSQPSANFHHRLQNIMTLPLNPPTGPVTLSQNTRTVLEKRYLVKNEKGQAVEQPEDPRSAILN